MWSSWISRCYLSRRQGCFGSSNKTAITFKYRSSRESWVGPFACTTDIKGDIILQKSPKYANCCRPQTHTHSLTHSTSLVLPKEPKEELELAQPCHTGPMFMKLSKKYKAFLLSKSVKSDWLNVKTIQYMLQFVFCNLKITFIRCWKHVSII